MYDSTPDSRYVQLPLFPERKCPKCGRVYPHTSEFWHRNKKRSDGFACWCKPCAAANKRRWKQKDVERANALARDYYYRNRDRARKVAQEYRIHNREQVNASNRKSYYKHGDKAKQLHRKWRVNNPHKMREYSRRRRALKYGAEGTHTAEEMQQLYIQQQGKCFHCGTGISTGYHGDHWIPISRGGSDWISNIRLLCPPCNLSKGDKLPREWKPEKYAH